MTDDSASIAHARAVLEATVRSYGGDTLISAPGLPFHPAFTYAETHFALAALLLALLNKGETRWLDIAAARLRLWNDHKGPATFFNAMAVCLMGILLRRSGVRHGPLEDILTLIVARTNEHRRVAYGQWSGNNCYLQQVVVDLVLLPLARDATPKPDALAVVANEFRRYRTPEGFFFDLPREGLAQERLAPPTYIMKILFLLGLCEHFSSTTEIRALFLEGMDAVLPLLTQDGSFSYFGRTDNSPFAAGLTIFNLRQAAALGTQNCAAFWTAATHADTYYQGFPRNGAGLLECNRFSTGTRIELAYSRDMYAKVGEYSVASCAYALLGYYMFPLPRERPFLSGWARAQTAQSQDLGLVRISEGDCEIVLRTTSEVTSWDRRYLGPTVLRFAAGGELLVGAVSKTVSSDEAVAPPAEKPRIKAISDALARWFVHGFEQLDATTVGFVPVIREGPIDYLPYRVIESNVAGSRVETRYRMLRLGARGFPACAVELRERLRRRIPGTKQGEYGRPFMRPDDSFELVRTVELLHGECHIHDRITGRLRGTAILLSTRAFASADVRVDGLERIRTLTGWGSDGKQSIDVYSGSTDASELRYQCVIRVKDRLGAP